MEHHERTKVLEELAAHDVNDLACRLIGEDFVSKQELVDLIASYAPDYYFEEVSD